MANRGGAKRKPKWKGRRDLGNDAALVFDAERKTYRAHLPELLASGGEFVLIRGENVAGTFNTYEDALEAGYAKYGPAPFLVKRINTAEPILYFSRDVR